MEITKDILYVGVNDHLIDLFEGQYDVPNGMAYNSYLICDEKIAVMDSVDAHFTDEWITKIAAALESAFTGLEMSLKQRVFQPGEGLTMDSVEDTIAAVGRMGRVGMKSTDVEILNIMLGH